MENAKDQSWWYLSGKCHCKIWYKITEARQGISAKEYKEKIIAEKKSDIRGALLNIDINGVGLDREGFNQKNAKESNRTSKI